MKLHHCAYTITKGYSSLLQELCEHLGAEKIWEGQDRGREIAMRFENGFSLQFSEVEGGPLALADKQETHMAFADDDPQETITRLAEWFSRKGVGVKRGAWSEDELWLDCPEVFLNFVIEVFKD